MDLLGHWGRVQLLISALWWHRHYTCFIFPEGRHAGLFNRNCNRQSLWGMSGPSRRLRMVQPLGVQRVTLPFQHLQHTHGWRGQGQCSNTLWKEGRMETGAMVSHPAGEDNRPLLVLLRGSPVIVLCGPSGWGYSSCLSSQVTSWENFSLRSSV